MISWKCTHRYKCRSTSTWSSSPQRLVVTVFGGHFTVTAKWEPLKETLTLCDKSIHWLYRCDMKLTIRAGHPYSPIWSKSLVFSAYYETFPLFSCTHFPSLSHRLFSLSVSPLLKLIFPNSLPPSPKTRDNNVSHDGKGWQKVKQTLCAVVLIIEEEKQRVCL